MRPLKMICFVPVLLLFVSCQKQKGVSEQSFLLAGQFVMITNGYDRGEVTYVVVRNWPQSSTPEERNKDLRLISVAGKGWLVQESLGHHVPLNNQQVLFFFERERLTTVPLRMREDDFMKLKKDSLTSYGELLTFFRQFKIGQAK